MSDDLNEIGRDVTLHAINAQLTTLMKESREHRAWHRRAHRAARWIAGTVGGLVLATSGWGATEFRGRVEAQARAQAAEVAIQHVRDARVEHSELRAQDRLLEEQIRKTERELEVRIASRPLNRSPDVLTP